MTKLQKTTFIFIILLFASCKKNENNIEFNRNVLAEILPIIVDSTCVDTRIFSNPPPRYGKLIFNKEGHYVRTDSTIATPEEIKNLKEWKQQVTDIKKDTSKVIIAFDSKILPYEKEYEKIVVKNFPKDTLLKIKEDKTKEYILNYKNIKLNGKFKLKNINEFDKENIFERKYKFNFSGILRVSGIKFDKKKVNGILDVGFTCGHECGYGNKIFIRKIKNKWKIIKMEQTWIS
ncbi:hypothetical protein OX283_014910 [Flavobacterium sp. SUN052]|uniref:hypothetical protein n=1 Tax=Flavobacterium sp. SUN052 TaxID=3002441 RepID=UPI00237EA32F|nr:hypothetical protein [Flavobacterium sp. SUN052]MEC4005952.1 hypothetical protein [Flavobacterium sp. SUN052]